MTQSNCDCITILYTCGTHLSQLHKQIRNDMVSSGRFTELAYDNHRDQIRDDAEGCTCFQSAPCSWCVNQ